MREYVIQTIVINYSLGEMPHLERVQLGVKRIRRGHHREMNFHNHRFSELTLIQHSSGTIHWAEGCSCQLKRGDVILMHPGKLHAYEHAHELELFNLLYEADKLPLPQLDGSSIQLFPLITSSHNQDKTRPPEKPILHLSETQLIHAETLAEALENELTGNAPGKNLRSFAIFIDLLTFICQAGGGISNPKDHANPVSAALRFINNNYREPLNIDQLARNSNMSRRNFFRKFRDMTGETPWQYIKKRRLAAAEELLKNSTLSLSEIAAECGFFDSNHLNYLFRSSFKCTPGSLRKKG